MQLLKSVRFSSLVFSSAFSALATFVFSSAAFAAEPFMPGCPWYDLHEQHPPNIHWCEAMTCSWAVTPFNTFTNLGYIFIGIYLWAKLRHSPSKLLKSFGPSAIMVGLSSGVYHATLNFYSQIFDFFGMYIFCMLLIMFNLARVKRWPAPPRAFFRFWTWVVGLTALTTMSLLVSLKFPIQIYVLVLILITMKTEFMHKNVSRRYFWCTAACMLIASVVSSLDLVGVLCWPSNHYFQGHGHWHLLTALALYFSYLHYRQFEKELI